MTPIFLDTETASGVDLRNTGGRVYAKHPSTRLLCLSYEIDGVMRTWFGEGGAPDDLTSAAASRPVAAHNASSFDAYVWDRFVRTPVHSWIDTIYMARAAGLPGGLDQLGEYFTGRGKDAGASVLKKCMKLEWNGSAWVNRYLGAGSIAAIARYCERDVELLRIIYEKLHTHPWHDPDGLAVHEAINKRGVAFDMELAARVCEVSTALVAEAAAEIATITNGEIHSGNLRSIPQMSAWLQRSGVSLSDLRRETVERYLADPLVECEEESAPPPVVAEVLRLRSCALRITGAKLQRAAAMCDGGRIYDLLTYHTAGPGRWSSRGLQIHNLPRGNAEVDTERLCRDCSLDVVRGEAVRVGVRPDDVLSSLIRPCLVAAEGCSLVIADFNAIENRVLGWLAREEAILDVFRSGRGPYEDMASVLYGIEYGEVTKVQRQAAKAIVLGGGYQLGPKKLAAYAEAIGAKLSGDLTPEFIVDTFRNRFPAVAGYYDGEWEGRAIRRGGLWNDYQRAWIDVVTGARGRVKVGRCEFVMHGRSLLITLPSGRAITYRKARVVYRVPSWGGDERPCCVYQSPRGEKTVYGGLLTENADQGTSRDILANAMVRIEAAGLAIVAHCHDEAICEVPCVDALKAKATIEQIMASPPDWAEGLPLKAEAHISQRYGKA